MEENQDGSLNHNPSFSLPSTKPIAVHPSTNDTNDTKPDAANACPTFGFTEETTHDPPPKTDTNAFTSTGSPNRVPVP